MINNLNSCETIQPSKSIHKINQNKGEALESFASKIDAIATFEVHSVDFFLKGA